ncbi:MAG: C39 family peptidase [Patescibacteria group bacterium]|nr:C39 family peptidase [Patescibacteria group bacterium]
MKLPKNFPHLINFIIWGFISAGLIFYLLQGSNPPAGYLSIFKNDSSYQPQSQDRSLIESAAIQPAQTSESELESLPQKILNPAPFVPQAPFANWDQLHEEACEEAVIITAHYYLRDQKNISKQKAEEEILKMIQYQEKNFNGHHDLDAEHIVKLAREFYNDQYQIKKEFTQNDIKKYLARKTIIIVPAAGRVLENPNFKQPGPLYHALVIIGYDEKKQQFITNDPGTRKGSEFRYSYKNLMQSIHDFPGKKEQILQGEKIIILVEK